MTSSPEARTILNPSMLTFHPEMVAYLYHGLGFPFLSEKTDIFGDSSPYAKAGTDPVEMAVVPFWITGEHPGELEHHLFRLQELGNALKHEEHGYPPRVKAITYVFPYMEGRGDKITRVRQNVNSDEFDALTALFEADGRRLVVGETDYAEMFAEAIAGPGRADAAVLLDPHSALLHRELKKRIKKVLTVTAVPLFAEWVLAQPDLMSDDIVVAAPDLGAISRDGHLAELLNRPLVLLDKWRPKHGAATVTVQYGDVRDKTVICLDEVIDSAGTVTEGANVLHDEGAKKVIVLSTAAKLSGAAISRLDKSMREGKIAKVVVTDSLPSSAKGKILSKMGFEILPSGDILVNATKTILDPHATPDTYGIKNYVFRDETPQEAYLRLKDKFQLPTVAPTEFVS